MWVAGRREGVRPIWPARVLRTSVWLCPTRNPARELLFLQGGPAAQEWRTAEGGRPEKGQLPVFGGLGKACGLFNFSISTPSPQHLRIVPLLPASLLLPDTCTNRCCSVALAAHWRPKNPSCASNPCLDMLVTGGTAQHLPRRLQAASLSLWIVCHRPEAPRNPWQEPLGSRSAPSHTRCLTRARGTPVRLGREWEGAGLLDTIRWVGSRRLLAKTDNDPGPGSRYLSPTPEKKVSS